MTHRQSTAFIGILLLGLQLCLTAQAQNISLDASHHIVVRGASFGYDGQTIALNEHSILVNGHINGGHEMPPYVFSTFQDAMHHVQQVTDGQTIRVYLAPYVYWVDNPDTPEVVEGKNGREPFGMTIRYKKLHLIGLTPDASRVVLASQRGQTQGAIGNFTMFDFHVDSLWVSHLTMGNYCNVDLDYPLLPALNRKKRGEAITQAHVGSAERRGHLSIRQLPLRVHR